MVFNLSDWWKFPAENSARAKTEIMPACSFENDRVFFSRIPNFKLNVIYSWQLILSSCHFFPICVSCHALCHLGGGVGSGEEKSYTYMYACSPRFIERRFSLVGASCLSLTRLCRENIIKPGGFGSKEITISQRRRKPVIFGMLAILFSYSISPAARLMSRL
jgi:hypothetical protein